MMATTPDRRLFLKKAAALPLLPLTATPFAYKTAKPSPRASYQIKLSCNLYSFNALLEKGEMSLEEVVRYCADLGFDAVDPTGYYFPGYPDPPQDAFVYDIKQKAFLLGLDISGTGVRNDFTLPEGRERQAHIALVQQWIEVAAKLGAPVIRVFAGKSVPEGFSHQQTLRRVIEGIKTCVAYGKQKGVMVVLQNHNEFLKTAHQVLHIREQVASDWFGLNVDIGSLREGDPYEQIERLAPYACTWQIKEKVFRQGKEEDVDLRKIVAILRNTGYRGYIPLETLGAGDPKAKIAHFLEEVRRALT